MEQVFTAVPYPVTDGGMAWGIVCPVHPTYLGNNVPTDWERCSAEAFAAAVACVHPGHYVPGTLSEWRTVDPVTGECHLFTADGRNLSVQAGAPEFPPCPPETAVNAVIVAAMREHTYRDWYADSKWAQWCDMTPVVTRWYAGGDSELCPNDVWTIEVQYSSRGGRAVYGVTRDNVPQCYMD
jgi:hypothetical protein